jgi:probable HAF family extracellular repeat protein
VDERSAVGINDSNEVVGYYQISNQNIHGYRWSNGTSIDLGSLGGTRTYARAIASSGVVVGSSETPDHNSQAFTWSDANGNGASDPGEMVQLPDSGLSSSANAISPNGSVVGFALRPNFTREASVWVNGARTALPSPLGATDTEARAVNSAGTVVGMSSDAPILWQGGQVYNLYDLLAPNSGWIRLSWVYGMNEQGQIVGSGLHGDPNTLHAFILTPVPAPAAAWTLLAGFLVAARRRRPD